MHHLVIIKTSVSQTLHLLYLSSKGPSRTSTITPLRRSICSILTLSKSLWTDWLTMWIFSGEAWCIKHECIKPLVFFCFLFSVYLILHCPCYGSPFITAHLQQRYHLDIEYGKSLGRVIILNCLPYIAIFIWTDTLFLLTTTKRNLVMCSILVVH